MAKSVHDQLQSLDLVLRIQVIDPVDTEMREWYKDHKAARQGDAGIDLFVSQDTVVPAHSSLLIPLGVRCALGNTFTERLYSYDLRSRSSIYKTPLIQQNGVGLCDSSFSGELKIAAHNLSGEDYLVTRGTRLVQISSPYLSPIKVQLVEGFHTVTERGEGGFGSTGTGV